MVAAWLGKHGTNFIKEIPFETVWNAFWNAPSAHIFVEETHKLAVVYAFNTETCQYIGGLLDTTPKKDLDLFHKEHSIANREAIVIRDGVIVRRFVKEENKHCFPIFPRWNPKTIQHVFNIDGWYYYTNCRDIKLRQLEDPQIEINDAQSENNSKLCRRHPLQT